MNHFLAIGRLRKCPLDGVRLRVAIPHGDLNCAVARDSGQREGIATRPREIGQRRLLRR